MTSVLWFRRDLRITDHPALRAAAADGPVLGLFVIEPGLWERAGDAPRAWLAASLQALIDATDAAVTVRVGDPAEVLVDIARESGATRVHVTGECTPFGRRRDTRVAAALAAIGAELVAGGTPYAVDPGTLRTRHGQPYQVFTPYARAWQEHGWSAPVPAPPVTWVRAAGDRMAPPLIRAALSWGPASMPTAGESAAARRWDDFRTADLLDYATARDLPGADRTSRMSPYLKVGAIHPRQLLAGLPPGAGAERFATELAWREFYADVLWHHPASAWSDLRTLRIGYDEPGEAFEAWASGRTGFPIVDAGMRQLRHEGWMHNRVRMIAASFLTKDLHAWWPAGARHFLTHLIDGDLASNSHGWQWVAGTGTDAAPYFRVFNPVTQARTFDPDGDYVRRWVPELAHLHGSAVHEPWKHPLGYEGGYPPPIVEHAAERAVALGRYAARGAGSYGPASSGKSSSCS